MTVSPRLRLLAAAAVVGLLTAGIGPARAADPLAPRGVCTASGPLIVTSTNEVRFSASGTCGLSNVTIQDELAPSIFPGPYPSWTGGCGYGPGPFPPLLLSVSFTDPLTGALVARRDTSWNFPDLVVGDNRASAPNSATRIEIHAINVTYIHGPPTWTVGGVIGYGVLLTRLFGSCDVTSPSTANASVTFVIYDLTSVTG